MPTSRACSWPSSSRQRAETPAPGWAETSDGGERSQPALGRRGGDRDGQRVPPAGLGRRGQAKQLGLADAGARQRHDPGQLGPAPGQGTGLVEGERVALGQPLERGASLDQHAVTRQPGHARQDGRRRGQHQGARAGDHQHRHGPEPDIGPAEPVAGRERRAGDDLDHGQEIPRQPVGRALAAAPCAAGPRRPAGAPGRRSSRARPSRPRSRGRRTG